MNANTTTTSNGTVRHYRYSEAISFCCSICWRQPSRFIARSLSAQPSFAIAWEMVVRATGVDRVLFMMQPIHKGKVHPTLYKNARCCTDLESAHLKPSSSVGHAICPPEKNTLFPDLKWFGGNYPEFRSQEAVVYRPYCGPKCHRIRETPN